jgi:hypothetical protein
MFAAIGVGTVTSSGIATNVPPPAGFKGPASEPAVRKYALISFLMSNLHPIILDIGYTQADRVTPSERSSPGEAGIDTRLLGPSNIRARPNLS